MSLSLLILIVHECKKLLGPMSRPYGNLWVQILNIRVKGWLSQMSSRPMDPCAESLGQSSNAPVWLGGRLR